MVAPSGKRRLKFLVLGTAFFFQGPTQNAPFYWQRVAFRFQQSITENRSSEIEITYLC